ncbi:hypothetical protein ES703_46068 [subsurface metagenome]
MVKSHLKLYPKISEAALRAKLDKELAAWHELRCLDVPGCGWLLYRDAVAGLTRLFGYPYGTPERILSLGEGKFWDIRPGPRQGFATIIEYYSLQKICLRLGIQHSGYPVEVRVQDFKGRWRKRALIYSSISKPEGEEAKPISRESIAEVTGISKRQQQRYDKVTHTRRTANFAFQRDNQGKLVPMLHLVKGKCRQWLKHRRLGNTYHTKAISAPRGMTRRVSALLRQGSLLGEEALSPKRFFLSARAFIRSPERHEEPFLLTRRKDRLIKGRMEWCQV